MTESHLGSLEGSLKKWRALVSESLLTSETKNSSGNSGEIREQIRNLKLVWREFSEVCTAVQAIKRSNNDIVVAGCLKAERKVVAGRIETAVHLLNQALMELGDDLESDFVNSLGTSLSSVDCVVEEKTPIDADILCSDNYTNRLFERSDIGVLSPEYVRHNLRQSVRTHFASETALRQLEISGRREFERWMRLSLGISSPSSDAAVSCYSSLKQAFVRYGETLNDLANFHTKRGEVVEAERWQRIYHEKKRAVLEVGGRLYNVPGDRSLNPFLDPVDSEVSKLDFSGFHLLDTQSNFNRSRMISSSTPLVIQSPERNSRVRVSSDRGLVEEGEPRLDRFLASTLDGAGPWNSRHAVTDCLASGSAADGSSSSNVPHLLSGEYRSTEVRATTHCLNDEVNVISESTNSTSITEFFEELVHGGYQNSNFSNTKGYVAPITTMAGKNPPVRVHFSENVCAVSSVHGGVRSSYGAESRNTNLHCKDVENWTYSCGELSGYPFNVLDSGHSLVPETSGSILRGVTTTAESQLARETTFSSSQNNDFNSHSVGNPNRHAFSQVQNQVSRTSLRGASQAYPELKIKEPFSQKPSLGRSGCGREFTPVTCSAGGDVTGLRASNPACPDINDVVNIPDPQVNTYPALKWNGNQSTPKITLTSQQILLESELLRGRGEKFCGEVETYAAWRDSIVESISKAGSSFRATIEILLANTGGTAWKIVDQIFRSQLPPEIQVKTVWNRLETRYGSEPVLSRSLLEWLRKFPRIISPNDIDRMDQLVTFCYSISYSRADSMSINYLSSPEGQREVWCKMPEEFVNRWRRTCATLRRRNSTPTMAHLVEAMENYVQERGDPYFFEGFHSKGTIKTALRSETTVNEKGLKSCPLHKSTEHSLEECRQFNHYHVKRRRDIVREEGLCFNCLGPHMARDCPSTENCERCKANHHSLLHLDQPMSLSSRPQSSETTSNCAILCGSPGEIRSCSKTLPVRVRLAGTRQTLDCLCIIDEQSNSSFCDGRFLDLFQVNSKACEYSVTTMNGLKQFLTESLIEGFEIRGWGEEEWIALPPLRTHPSIPDTRKEMATRKIVSSHEHVRRFSDKFLDSVPDLDVLLLLGTDCGPAMRTRSYGNRFPFVHHTALGWALVGPACVGGEEAGRRCLRVDCISEHFSIESAPIPSLRKPDVTLNLMQDIFCSNHLDELPGLSQDDKQFMKIVCRGTKINAEGHLEFPLPIRDHVEFPKNKRAVYLRTRNCLTRASTKPQLARKCVLAMEKYISAGHVEQLPPQCSESELVNYVPVFPVEHPKKDSVRIVFDGAASYGGVSLNDNLLRGPDINGLLIGVILRFRLFRVGFSSDVECMFHCFHVSPEHRDLLRFFWWTNNVPGDKLSTYRAKVHVFGNRSSPAVAAYGLRYIALQSNLANDCPAAKFIRRDFYVDDGMASTETEREAVDLLKNARSLLAQYKVRLHKIVSSSREVLKCFPASEVAIDVDVVDLFACYNQTALGLAWNVVEDTLSVRLGAVDRPFTKRGVLSAIQSVFDPLGLVGPVLLGGKLIQRMVISSSKSPSPYHQFNWDDPLPKTLESSWEMWKVEISRVHQMSIPRCYTPQLGSLSISQLHIFSDACETAIGFVAYLRRIDTLGRISVGFVMAKSKVAPRAATSIPRLELCAAAEAARASAYLREELHDYIETIHMYTDSCVVLGYLGNSSKNFSRYVSARVQLALSCTSFSMWNYVPTNLNPGDIACRSHTVVELLHSRWCDGPSFLYSEPVTSFNPPERVVNLPETVPQPKCLTSHLGDDHDHRILTFLETKNYSWLTMVRIIARVFYFVEICRKRILLLEQANWKAVVCLLRSVQRQQFPREVDCLHRKSLIPETSRISSLSPFLDETGVLRVGGRLGNSDLPYIEKHPALLPSSSFITQAILSHFHNACFHQGRHITTSCLRHGGYHIHNQKSVIGKFLGRCVICRKLRGCPQTQLMSCLPKDRVTRTPPFWHSGVDIFGPYVVYDGRTTRRKLGSKKVWVVLFTCLYSRAIHVDLISSLDSATFHLALRRFTSLRGQCKLYRSDCGTNFVGLENQRMSDTDLKELTTQSENLTWKFLPPGASHFAGVWERKVGSIKRILNVSLSLLDNTLLSREEFSTLILEAASIVNHTPFGEVSSDPNEPFPVSPAALLTLRENSLEVHGSYCKDDLLDYGRQRWRRVQYLADQFWVRWRRDYLRSVDQRRKWKKQRRNLHVGDVVLIRDKCARNLWPMGLVTETHPDRNGFVRRVTLRRSSEDGKCRSVERAITDVVLLIPCAEAP